MFESMEAMQIFGRGIAHPDLEKVEIPVGQICYRCEEPILETEVGFIQSCLIRRGDDGEFIHTREPIHRECMIRATVGSVKHQRGECSCFTGDFSQHDDDEEYATKREAARAALAEFEKKT